MCIGRRLGLDPTLLWLWRRPVAMAPIRPLAWEPPYAMGAALEKAKRQKIFFFFLFRAVPMAYGSSWTRDLTQAIVAGLHHSHSNAGSLTH